MASLALAFDILARDKASKEFDKVGDSAEKAGRKGAQLGPIVAAGVAALGAAAVGAGKLLFDIGSTFDDVSDTIRVGTGASGDALNKLVESAKNVGRTVPAEFGEIGSVVADLNTRLGLTGPTLETLSSQFLEAGRMLGEAVDVNTVTGAFNAFKIEGEATTDAMDRLFQVSQATGVGINELATSLSANAPAVQNLGFNFEETAGLIGTLDKAGLNTSQMMSGLSRSLVNLAKDGEEPQDAFRRTVGEIEGFIAAGDTAAAIDLAGKAFGTRGASQFIGAIQSGALALGDLANVGGMTGDTILGVAEDTKDFSERWQEFKNQAMLELEPIATRVFGVLSEGMNWLSTNGIPTLKEWGGWIQRNGEWLAPIAVAIGTIVGAITVLTAVTKAFAVAQAALNIVLAANPIGIVVLAIAGLVAGLIYAWNNSETFRNIVIGVWDAVRNFVVGAATAVRDWVVGAWDWISSKTQAIWQAIKEGIIVQFNFIMGVIGKVVEFRDKVVNAFTELKDKAVAKATELVTWVTGLPGRLLDAIGDIAGKFKDVGSDIIQGIINGVTGSVGKIKDAVTEAASSALNAAKDFLGISSPSKVFRDQVGAMLPAGMVQGILAGQGAVRSAVNSLVAIPSVGVPAMPGGIGMPVMAGAASGSAPVGAGATVVVNPSPGMDERMIGQAAANALTWAAKR